MADKRNSNQHENPRFVNEMRPYDGLGSSTSPFQIYGVIFLALIAFMMAFIIGKISWKVAVTVVAAYLVIVILGVSIRFKKIKQATQTGFVNKNGQVNCSCMTPEWKYYESIYKLECKHCGNTYDVRADRIRSKKCPACQKK